MPAHGILLHHFHGGVHAPHAGAIDADELRELIDFLGRDRILPAREWLDRAAAGALRDGDLILTFDDNLRCQFDVAVPVLAELRISAAFFVCSGVLSGGIEQSELYRHFRATCFESCREFHDAFFSTIDRGPYRQIVRQALLRFNPPTCPWEFADDSESERRFRFVRDQVLGADAYERVMDQMFRDCNVDQSELARQLWMTPEHIRALHAEGHVIGLHSHTHPSKLGGLSPQQQREEYTANWRCIRQLTGVPPVAMSHPEDSYGPYTLAILRQLRLRVGFRSNMARCGQSEFELPREDQVDLMRIIRQSRHEARVGIAA